MTRLDYDLSFVAHVNDEKLKTPAGNLLVLPNKRMADRMAIEWQKIRNKESKYQSNLLKYANTALDHVASSPEAVADAWLGYVETDLLLYRASEPVDLVIEQNKAWRPALSWAEEKFGEQFILLTGITHKPQSPTLLKKMREHAASFDAFSLCALAQGGGLLGSSILALALVERAIDAETAYKASLCDELFQSRLWGEPEEMVERRQSFRRELDDLAEFIQLLVPQTPE